MLLLFLICAVAASVLIAAGSAAAGRASQLSNSDKLYYSVTSAANVFRDQLFKDVDKTRGYEVTVALRSDSSNVSVSFDGKEKSSDFNLLTKAAVFAMNKSGGASPTWETAPKNVGELASGNVAKIDLNHDDDLAFLDLKVQEDLDGSGNLVFEFSDENDAQNLTATISLICEPEVFFSDEISIPGDSESDPGYKFKYVTFVWTPSRIEKG